MNLKNTKKTKILMKRTVMIENKINIEGPFGLLLSLKDTTSLTKSIYLFQTTSQSKRGSCQLILYGYYNLGTQGGVRQRRSYANYMEDLDANI